MPRASTSEIALPFQFRVAGTGYEGRYSTIRRHGALRAEARLIPQPSNAHDSNAIEVRMLWHTEKGSEVWDTIGYVPADVSPVVGRLISSGEWAIERVFVRKLDVSADLDSPRVTIRIEGKDLRHATC